MLCIFFIVLTMPQRSFSYIFPVTRLPKFHFIFHVWKLFSSTQEFVKLSVDRVCFFFSFMYMSPNKSTTVQVDHNYECFPNAKTVSLGWLQCPYNNNWLKYTAYTDAAGLEAEVFGVTPDLYSRKRESSPKYSGTISSVQTSTRLPFMLFSKIWPLEWSTTQPYLMGYIPPVVLKRYAVELTPTLYVSIWLQDCFQKYGKEFEIFANDVQVQTNI